MLLNKSHQNVKSNNNFESATEHQNILSQPALAVPKKKRKNLLHKISARC